VFATAGSSLSVPGGLYVLPSLCCRMERASTSGIQTQHTRVKLG